MTRRISSDTITAMSVVTNTIQCIDSIEAGDMDLIDDKPCLGQILSLIPERTFIAAYTEDILTTIYRRLYANDAIVGDKYCGVDIHNPIGCLEQIIDVTDKHPVNRRSDLNLLQFESVIGHIARTEKCNNAETFRYILHNPTRFRGYITDILRDAPERLEDVCEYHTDGNAISCFETLLSNLVHSGYYHRTISTEIYADIEDRLLDDTKLAEVARKPLMRDRHDDGTTDYQSFYNWISSGHRQPGYSFLSVLPTTNCTGRDSQPVACIDVLLNNNVGTIYRILSDITGDELHTAIRNQHCRTDNGDPTPCLNRYLDVAHAHFHDNGTSYLLGRIMPLIDTMSLEIASNTCTNDAEKPISCLQKIVDIATFGLVNEQYPGSGGNEIFNLLNRPAVKQKDCSITTESGKVSCIEYIMNSIQTAIPDAISYLLQNPVATCSIAKSRTGIFNNAISSILSNDAFIAENISDITAHLGNDAANIISAYKCGVPTTSTFRKCYDEISFTLANTSNDRWVTDIIQSGTGFDPRHDKHNITGVYTVSFTTARDPDIVFKYIETAKTVLASIRDLLGDGESISIANDDAIADNDGCFVNDIEVLVHTHSTGSHTYKLDRIIRNRDVRRIVTGDSSIAKRFEELQTSKPSRTPQKLTLIISNRPYDMLRASTYQNWTSCFNLRRGQHRDTIHTFIDYGAYIAYLAKDEWSPQWFARMWILPTTSRNCLAVQPVYGLPEYTSVLNDAVTQLLAEHGINIGSFCDLSDDDDIFPWDGEISTRGPTDEELHNMGYKNCINSDTVRESVYDDLVDNIDPDEIRNSDEYTEALNTLIDEFIDETGVKPSDYDLTDLEDSAYEAARESYEPSYIDVNDAVDTYCEDNADDYTPEDINYDDYPVRYLTGYDGWIDQSRVDPINPDDIDEIRQIHGEGFVTFKKELS